MHVDIGLKSWTSIIRWGAFVTIQTCRWNSPSVVLSAIWCIYLFLRRFHPSKVGHAQHGIFRSMSIQVPMIVNTMPVHCCIYFVHVISTRHSQCHGNSAQWLSGKFDQHIQVRRKLLLKLKLSNFLSVQAMTRTAPVYTVRWSSQISRTNNRLGPPTPAPNAASAATSSHIKHILHAITSNFHSHTNRIRKLSNSFNYFFYDSNSPKQQQYLRLFSLDTFNILLFALWIYKFIGIELTFYIKSKLIQST